MQTKSLAPKAIRTSWPTRHEAQSTRSGHAPAPNTMTQIMAIRRNMDALQHDYTKAVKGGAVARAARILATYQRQEDRFLILAATVQH